MVLISTTLVPDLKLGNLLETEGPRTRYRFHLESKELIPYPLLYSMKCTQSPSNFCGSHTPTRSCHETSVDDLPRSRRSRCGPGLSKEVYPHWPGEEVGRSPTEESRGLEMVPSPDSTSPAHGRRVPDTTARGTQGCSSRTGSSILYFSSV